MQNEYSHSHNAGEIDSYLDGELDEHTLALFEEELIENSGLVADVSFHREVNRAILETDVMALRASLKDISVTQQNQPDEKLGVTSPRRKSLIWYAAASVILLMFVVTSLLRNKTYTNQQLYTYYYQPYKGIDNVSRSAVDAYSGLSSALREIDHGNFKAALKSLDNTSVAERDGFSTFFYSGVAYQELGEYKRAINSFSEVVKHGDNLLVEQSEWYIGLCYLRIDEREKALAQFKAIVARKGFYREQSRNLMNQME
jgi:tetratricopeptide (TPR) repeat protein